MLGGETEREQEALGWGNLGARQYASQLGYNRGQAGQELGTIGSLLSSLLGA